MTQLPYLVCYLAFTVFVIAVVARIVMWSRLPMHLRWELYPVAHEPSEKARYGGSFMEETDWWTKPRQHAKLGVVKAMAPEILLLSAVRQHNKQLWKRTFPFHFGLYLSTAAVTMALILGLVSTLAPAALSGGVASAAQTAVMVTGVAGFSLGIFGALGLLHRRMTLPEARRFTVPADIFNLLFFIAAFGSGLTTFFLVDSDAQLALSFAAHLASFQMVPLPGSGLSVILPTTTVVLLSLLLAYIPLTHMSHFIGKWFAYHAIRWNDTPNLSGGPQEAEIGRLLGCPVSWAGQHIRGDGKKTWLDLALENPSQPPRENAK